MMFIVRLYLCALLASGLSSICLGASSVPLGQQLGALDLYMTYTGVATATSTSTASTLIKRDNTSSFAANVITANTFTGTAGAAINAHFATSATTATLCTGTAGAALYAHQFTGALSGDVTGTQGITTVASIGGKTAAQVANAVSSLAAATTNATPSTLVMRDSNGDVSYRVVNAGMEINLTNTGGMLYINNSRVLHGLGDTSNSNIFVGSLAGNTTLTSTRNTALGATALQSNRLGSNNLALGYGAGSNLAYGNNNIYLGHPGISRESSVIHLGTNLTHTACFIAGINGVNVGKSSVTVMIDNAGRLGTVISSARFKKDIAALPDKTQALLDLRPVSFKYKDGDDAVHYGLIAEEVETALPELVVRDAAGNVQTVAYHLLPIFLLQECQKLHNSLDACTAMLLEQDAIIAELKKAITPCS